MDAKMIFNLDDANCDLPTTGKAWEILLEHVKENAMHRDLYLGDLQDEDIIEEVKRRELSVGEVFDDQDILDHVHDGGMPIDEIFAEDEILGCGCVTDKIEELEDQIGELQEANDESEHDNEILKKKWRGLEKKVAELEKQNAELERQLAKDADVQRQLAEVVELERQLAEFREWNAKMKDNGNEEWCRRCGSWQNCERDGSDIIKDAKWGYVCHDCLHHLDNPDHERCTECDCCKGCDCCECDEEDDDIIEGQIVDDDEE
jgi:hypothetical protein